MTSVVMHALQVSEESSRPAVTHSAILTDERRPVLACDVPQPVQRQVRRPRISPLAVGTLERRGGGGHAGVGVDSGVVETQLGALREARGAHGALERTLAAVQATVRRQLRTSKETLATRVAHVTSTDRHTKRGSFQAGTCGNASVQR